MKTILIPVDFSNPAENAAKYAMNLASAIESDVLLCHAYLIPAEVTGSEQVVWPLYEAESLVQLHQDALQHLAKKLKSWNIERSGPDFYHPSITLSAIVGTPVQAIEELAGQHKCGLVVMGLSGAGALSRFVMGSVSRKTIDHIKYPVLLIPPGTRYREIRKIAFASDLDKDDIPAIHALGFLAARFNADLVITHIAGEDEDDENHKKKSTALLNEVTNKVNFDRIYYRYIRSDDIDSGLGWLSKEGKIDILAMVHKNKGVFSRIISGTHTTRLAHQIKIPLLVFPEKADVTF